MLAGISLFAQLQLDRSLEDEIFELIWKFFFLRVLMAISGESWDTL